MLLVLTHYCCTDCSNIENVHRPITAFNALLQEEPDCRKTLYLESIKSFECFAKCYKKQKFERGIIFTVLNIILYQHLFQFANLFQCF